MNEILSAINGVLQCWAEEDAQERMRQYQIQLDDEMIYFMELACGFNRFDYEDFDYNERF